MAEHCRAQEDETKGAENETLSTPSLTDSRNLG